MPITAKSLAHYVELDEERKGLEREARNIQKEIELIGDEFREELKRRKVNSVKEGSYQVQLVDGRASVSWKDEFIRIAGSERAIEIQDAAPIPKRLQVLKL